jgi:hypothetical protein
MPTRTTNELELRGNVAEVMEPFWHLTWHEDRSVSPGVPDLSFVMKGGGYETGWIELKAESEPSEPYRSTRFKLKPAQHRWIEIHRRLIPIFFLLEVGEVWYLVEGAHHSALSIGVSKRELESMSLVQFPRDKAAEHLPYVLRIWTLRNRS